VLSSGSVVRRGEGNGVVFLTGAKTYFGRTTELVQQPQPKLHIEAVVSKVVRWLFVIVGALLAVVIVLSLIRGVPLLEMIPLMLVLLMSAVPVALPVMFTVSMAFGSKELAHCGLFWSPAHPRATASCPNFVALWSSKLEGDLSQQDCSAMERHLVDCPSCSGACAALKRALLACRQVGGQVSPEVQASVKAALQDWTAQRLI
jgi:E1-E2 ATPase